MALQSINIELNPSTSWLNIPENSLTSETYAGYYLSISYNHILSGNTVFAKERVEIEDINQFRFFTPQADEIVNKEIKVEVRAPNGEVVFSTVRAVNSFFPAPKQKGKKDESNTYPIEIEPTDLTQSNLEIALPKTLKVNGRVIDISGQSKVFNLQVIIWATESEETEITFDTETFKPIYVGKTDKDGYFFGEYPLAKYSKAFATVANANANTVEIAIRENTNYNSLETPVIIALDFSQLEIDSDDCSCETATPMLPDGKDLLESGVYSQDLGGHCVNFTTPNRTLEEFLFYYAVRTTEPEIKGLTLNQKDVRLIRKKLVKTHNAFWQKAFKLQASLKSIELKPIEEINLIEQAVAQPQMLMRSFSTSTPNYVTASLANQTAHIQHNLQPVEASPTMVTSQLNTLKTKLNKAIGDVEDIQDKIKKFEKQIGNELSLEELYQYKEYYSQLENSVNEFIDLLDDYNGLYNSFRSWLYISNVYFVNNYSTLKSSFQDYLKEIEFRIKEIEQAYITNHPGRKNVSVENPIDWDDEPTIYQNTTIAHGHLLCFKQKWKAAGYSLGDLLYSLPLAPCQKKQIAIFDWDRSELASRSEIQTNEESLSSILSRDRDITEVMNSSFSESMQAKSESSGKTSGWSASTSASYGVPGTGPKIGVSGGYSSTKTSANSSASQNSSRNLSANALNKLQDTVQQSATSVRSQRSTVIQTVGQGETFNVTTEVIANHNHCHSLTIQYFEVLRHFAVVQDLVEVSECLFVPLEMSMFNIDKILRWKNSLKDFLLDRSLIKAFDSLERIKDEYKNSDLKNVNGAFAEETIEDLFGELRISFEIPRPEDPANDDDIDSSDDATKIAFETLINDSWSAWHPFFGGYWTSRMALYRARFWKRLDAQRDKIFEEEVVPKLVKNFVEQLQVFAIMDNNDEVSLDIDVTLISKYKKGIPLYISLRPKPGTYGVAQRSRIKQILIHSPADVPSTAKIVLHSGSLRYRTKHLDEFLFNSHNIKNDIIHNDAATIYTPLNTRELVNPKNQDYRIAKELIEHLNEYLEYYHRQLWYYMDSARLFNLLDGFIAPNSQSRSVSSVVENKIIGVVGNNLVMKVAPGYNLDPTFRPSKDFDLAEVLLNHYKPITPPDPFRISVPTKGVYAEAVMGACNSCEHIDESRHWRFTEVPCGDEPTAINPINTDSRRADPGNLQTKNMESPVINIQNAPNAPDPTGLGAALELMGKADIFENITGLDGTQKLALQQLLQNSKNLNHSQDLASHALDKAVELEKQKRAQQSGHTMRNNILEDFKDDPEKQKKYLEKLYDQQLGNTKKNENKSILDNPELKEKITKSKGFTYSNSTESISLEEGEEDLTERVSLLLEKLNDEEIDIYFPKDSINSIIDENLAFKVKNDCIDNVICMMFAGYDGKTNFSIGYDLLENIAAIEGEFLGSTSTTSFIGILELGSIQGLKNSGLYVFEITSTGLKILERWSNDSKSLSTNETLINYLTRTFTTYDCTENFVLGLSSHGSSYSNLDYLLLSGDDEPDSTISSVELNKILNDIKTSLPVFDKFSIIFTDSCMNGTIEKYYELSNHCNFFIGSEFLIEGTGYNYKSFVSSILNAEEYNELDFAGEILDSYYNLYSSNNYKIESLALLDSSLKSDFSNKLNTFIESVLVGSSDNFKSAFKNARKKSYDLIKLQYGSKEDGYDLYQFLQNLKDEISGHNDLNDLNQYLNDLIAFLEPAVGIIADCSISGRKNNDLLRGLGIWIPRSKRRFNRYKTQYSEYMFKTETKWIDLLEFIYE